MTSWHESLLQLQTQGTITGFALITAQGTTKPATGPFQAESSEGVSTALRQLVKTFYEAAEPPTAYELWGKKLVVIHQTDSCYVAVSKQRQTGIVALNLPGGVLLASFSRPVLPTAALTAVQATCTAALTGRAVTCKS